MALKAVLKAGSKGAKLARDFQKKVKERAGKAKEWFKDTVKRAKEEAQMKVPTFARKVYQRPADPEKEGLDRRGYTDNPSTPGIGGFYLYQYDPKWKEKLPWYDIFPLVFPFDYAAGGFYGINVHYLPPNARTDLMLRLLEAHGASGLSNPRFKMKLNYNIITKFKPAIPCIKRYLYGQVRGGGFYQIPYEDWSFAATLPMQKFVKASNNKVWKWSQTQY